MKNQRKSESVIEWCRCGKYWVMNTNFECLSWGEVQASGYFFQLSDMRYDDRNVLTTHYRVPEFWEMVYYSPQSFYIRIS